MRAAKRLLAMSLILGGFALPVLAYCDYNYCTNQALWNLDRCLMDCASNSANTEQCYAGCDAQYAVDLQTCETECNGE